MNAVLSPPRTNWTVLSLIEWSTNHLTQQGFDEARLHVELLLAHVLRFSRLQLYTNFDRPLSDEELAVFKTLFRRRLAHEPLQYILGETEFMGLPFIVNSSVLIPRPETEQLVEKALEAIRTLGKEHADVLDIGTGSGNIAIAIARFAPNANVITIDVSTEALATARANAERNGIDRITFLQRDILSAALPELHVDLVVSNPPYVSREEFATLQPEVRDFEPRIAATDEGNGFTFIRRIIDVSNRSLWPRGLLLMELSYNQSEEAKRIAAQAGFDAVEVLQDFSGIPRILSARKK